MNTIGQRIKAMRRKASLTQAELAEKAGTATGTIQQYELGKRQPRLEQLQKIADVLGCSIAYLASSEEIALLPTEAHVLELEAELREARQTIRDLKARLYDCVAAEDTIRELKAKLYDYMTAVDTLKVIKNSPDGDK